MKEQTMADKYISTAKVIDGVLILSLPDAVSPVVWQMELGQSKASALEIRNAENGQFILTLKTPRQDVLDIAAYANRDAAIKALLAASAALEKAQGQLKTSPSGVTNGYPVPVVTASRSGSAAWCLLKKILKISTIILGTGAVILLVLFVVGKLFLTPPSATNAASATSGGAVSADEFLENR